MTEKLTQMQKRYVWLAGSFPKLIVAQGQGVRSKKTLYALSEDRVIIFGYANPLWFMVNRGIFKRLQENNTFVLTDLGENIFNDLVRRDEGGQLNDEIQKVNLKESSHV